jgi:hypothetical protein
MEHHLLMEEFEMCNCDSEVPFDVAIENQANASYPAYRARAKAAEAEAKRTGKPLVSDAEARRTAEFSARAAAAQQDNADSGRTIIGELAIGTTPVSIQDDHAGTLTIKNNGVHSIFVGQEKVTPANGLWVAPGKTVASMIPQLSRVFFVSADEGASIQWKLCY